MCDAEQSSGVFFSFGFWLLIVVFRSLVCLFIPEIVFQTLLLIDTLLSSAMLNEPHKTNKLTYMAFFIWTSGLETEPPNKMHFISFFAVIICVTS